MISRSWCALNRGISYRPEFASLHWSDLFEEVNDMQEDTVTHIMALRS